LFIWVKNSDSLDDNFEFSMTQGTDRSAHENVRKTFFGYFPPLTRLAYGSFATRFGELRRRWPFEARMSPGTDFWPVRPMNARPVASFGKQFLDCLRYEIAYTTPQTKTTTGAKSTGRRWTAKAPQLAGVVGHPPGAFRCRPIDFGLCRFNQRGEPQ
jgi:hypothetical protein